METLTNVHPGEILHEEFLIPMNFQPVNCRKILAFNKPGLRQY